MRVMMDEWSKVEPFSGTEPHALECSVPKAVDIGNDLSAVLYEVEHKPFDSS